MAIPKYDDIRLKVAENGFILDYTEIRKKVGSKSTNQWENTTRDYKQEVFELIDGSGTKAVNRMLELASSSNTKIANAFSSMKTKVAKE